MIKGFSRVLLHDGRILQHTDHLTMQRTSLIKRLALVLETFWLLVVLEDMLRGTDNHGISPVKRVILHYGIFLQPIIR